jgi:hypothetical protein
VGVLVTVIVVLLLATAVVVISRRGDDDGDGARVSSGEQANRQAGLELPAVPEGFDLFADHDGSFALVVPDGWETVLMDSESVRRARDRLEDDEPEVAEALATVERVVGDRGQAFAAELDDEDGFVANLNLLLVPRSSGSLAELAESDRLGLEQAGAQVGDARAVRIGDRQGLIVDVIVPSPTRTITERQLYIASGYRVYVLTVVGVDADVAQTVVESLRVP